MGFYQLSALSYSTYYNVKKLKKLKINIFFFKLLKMVKSILTFCNYNCCIVAHAFITLRWIACQIIKTSKFFQALSMTFLTLQHFETNHLRNGFELFRSKPAADETEFTALMTVGLSCFSINFFFYCELNN